jgi:hypothetical protein
MGVIVPEIGVGGNLCNPARSLQFALHSEESLKPRVDAVG